MTVRRFLNWLCLVALLALPSFAGRFWIPPHPWRAKWLLWVVLFIAALFIEFAAWARNVGEEMDAFERSRDEV